MYGKLKRGLLILALCSVISGCRTPADLFSWIDRNCFVADWTNHHSCVSCCNCKHGGCLRPPQQHLPKLDLGNPPVASDEQNSTASNAVATAFDVE
jgi:hypothetical protein